MSLRPVTRSRIRVAAIAVLVGITVSIKPAVAQTVQPLVLGVDISHNNTVFDWTAVKNAPKSFVYVRATFGAINPQLDQGQNPCTQANWKTLQCDEKFENTQQLPRTRSYKSVPTTLHIQRKQARRPKQTTLSDGPANLFDQTQVTILCQRWISRIPTGVKRRPPAPLT